MRKGPIIVMSAVAVLFVLSWIIKAGHAEAATFSEAVSKGFWVTFAAFLTLAIMSFLYRDNPIYKFAEHLYVGVSAAYWMSLGFWTTLVANLFPKISPTLCDWFDVKFTGYQYHFFIPPILGIILLMRLLPKGGWISRWALAFIVGTTAGLNLPNRSHPHSCRYWSTGRDSGTSSRISHCRRRVNSSPSSAISWCCSACSAESFISFSPRSIRAPSAQRRDSASGC
jgi:hypothetical protein